MSEGQHDKAAKLIRRGLQEAENRRIAELAGEEAWKDFAVDSAIRYWAVSKEDGLPFPAVSPLDLAALAAPLLASSGLDETKACERAAKLIRAAALQIAREKADDERNQGFLADNRKNRRRWKNLGRRIEDLYAGTKNKPFRCSSRHSESEAPYPFPISMKELSTLAGLKEDAGRKRINQHLKDAIRAAHQSDCELAEMKGDPQPEPLSDAEAKARFAAWKKSLKEWGIYQPALLSIAREWPELQEVLRECGEEI